jgi:hypothetical protein
MKSPAKSLLLLLLAAVSVPVGAQQPTWTNFLRQRQALTGVELQTNVANNGSRLSLLPLEQEGAEFTIWTLKSGTGELPQLLATQFVDAYQNSATVAIETGDPYTLIPRTRVDKPFTVRVQVAGLRPIVTGGDTTGTSVRFAHTASNYGVGVHLPGSGMSTRTVFSGNISQNGMHVFNFSGTNIGGTNVAASSGEENFTVSSLLGTGALDTTLATGRMQVWPLSTATISGITNNATYTSMPEVTFNYSRLYPDSTTYVQIYPGQPSLGTIGTTLNSSIITIADVTPQNRTFILRNWDHVLPDDGRFTMEVLHTTPWGTERLGFVSFIAKRTIEVNGQIFSSE